MRILQKPVSQPGPSAVRRSPAAVALALCMISALALTSPRDVRADFADAPSGFPRTGQAPLTFYPDLDFSYTPDPNLMLTTVFVRLYPIGGEPAAALEQVSLASDGSFHSHFTCHFLGFGTLQVFSTPDPSNALPLLRMPIRCSPPDSSHQATQSGIVRSAALLADPPSPSPTVTGYLQSFIANKYETGQTTLNQSTPSSGSFTSTSSFENTEQDTFSGSQQCVVQTQLTRQSGLPDQTYTYQYCFATPPNPPYFDSFFVFADNRSFQSHTTSPSGATADQTSTYSDNRDVSMNVQFPMLPAGATLQTVQVFGSPVTLYLPASSYTLNRVQMTEQPMVFAAPGGCANGAVQGLATWILPGPPSGNTIAITTATNAACPDTDDGTVTAIDSFGNLVTTTTGGATSLLFGSLVFVGDVAQDLELLLEPASMSVTPTNRRYPKNPNIFGASSTKVRATLKNAPPGTYTARIRIDSFDAITAGHDHGNPPADFWGKLDQALEATCMMTAVVGSNADPSCEVTFQSDEVSGIATLIGTIDGQNLEAKKDLHVEIPNLSALDASPTYFLQGSKARHRSNHFGTTSTLTTLQQIATEFMARTNARIGVNDMSLPKGGLFDFKTDWTTPHKDHRVGRAADVDRRWILANGSTRLVECFDDADLDAAVSAKGAILICEPQEDGSSNKHINF